MISLFKGIGATLFCLLLYPFKSSQLDHPPPHIAAKPNVLLVHGYLHNETPWYYYRRHLQSAGLGPVDTICYPSIRWDIPKNSAVIKNRIQQIKEHTGKDVHILIGHSLGGLVCLEYALEHSPKDKLTYVVTLGSPLHGTSMTRFGFGPSVKQMQIDSDYLKSLHARLQKAQHIRVLALAADRDAMIHPHSSAHLSDTPHCTTEEIKEMGHVSFLFSEEAVDRIVAFLKRERVLN